MTMLSGRILTIDDLPMPWVGVILDPATKEQVVTLTNQNGDFAFVVQPGKHELAVRTFAYSPFTEFFEVASSGRHVTVKLRPTLRRLMPS